MDRQLLNLYDSVFVGSLGLAMSIYFIPVFAQKFDATFLDLGFIGGANSLAYAITPLMIGYLADRFNRAWLFALALVANSLATIILTVAGSVGAVVLFRLLGGLAYGVLWATAEVMVADLALPAKRVGAMGLYGVASELGFVIGPLVGGFVLQNFGFTPLFLISAIIIALSLIPHVVWVLPRYRSKAAVLKNPSGSPFPIRGLVSWYVMALCYGILFGNVVAIFPGYANSVGILPFMIGVLFTAFGISRIFVFAASETVSKLGEKSALSVASGIVAVGALLIETFPSFFGFLIALIIIGGGFGVIFPLTISIISRYFSQERLGVAIGSYEAVFGAGSAIGPLVGGAIAALANVSLTFLLTSFVAGFMVILSMIGRVNPTPAEGQDLTL